MSWTCNKTCHIYTYDALKSSCTSYTDVVRLSISASLLRASGISPVCWRMGCMLLGSRCFVYARHMRLGIILPWSNSLSLSSSCLALCSSLLFSALVLVLALGVLLYSYLLLGSAFLYTAAMLYSTLLFFTERFLTWLFLSYITNSYIVGYVGMRTQQYTKLLLQIYWNNQQLVL